MSREVNQTDKEYKLDLMIELRDIVNKNGKSKHWFVMNQTIVTTSIVNDILYCNYENTYQRIGVLKLERLIEYANSLKGTEEER